MKKWILLAYCLFGGWATQAQQNIPRFITDSLDTYIKQGMAQWEVPAVALAIVKDGKVIVSKGYGYTRLGGKEPVDENTLFMIGSNSKLFTATAVTLLEQQGALKLTDKVQKWLPYFKLKNAFASQEANIIDILSHRIGFETFQGDFTNWGSKVSREEVVRKMAVIDAPYEFRTNWGYSNAGFVAAGEIIGKASGKKWEDYIKEQIIKPLHMDRTLMLTTEMTQASNIAYPYDRVDGKLQEIPFVNIDNLAAAGSICSSARDMSQWLLAQLQNGELDGKRVLPAAALEATRQPHSTLYVDTRFKKHSHFSLYGLGLGITDNKERVVYSHTGGVDGFLTHFLFIPEEQLGIVLLTNSMDNAFYYTAMQDIQDAFLGLPTQTNEKVWKMAQARRDAEKKELEEWRTQVKNASKTHTSFAAYTGKFTNPLYGDIEITAIGRNLLIHFPLHGEMTCKLEYMGNDNFMGTFSWSTMGISKFSFKREGGKIVGLTFQPHPFVEKTPYVFERKL